MATRTDKKGALVQGTLDMLILRTLDRGAGHGHDNPALHRLERKGLVSARWEVHKERKREFKYYRLTPAGRRQLQSAASRWRELVDAIASVMRPERAK